MYATLLKLTEAGTKNTTLEAIILTSQIVKRKVQVLMAYLEKEKMVQNRKGISLKKVFSKGEELELFLTHYEERLGLDKVRIQEIMKYGQTTDCRACFFRDYFGEKHGELCKRCDNCRGKFLSPAPASAEWTKPEELTA